MNEPDNVMDSGSDSRQQVESLRRHLGLIFAAVIISSFTLTAYLGVQARRASKELYGLRQRQAEELKLLEQDNNAVQSVYGKLVEFGQTHPDFQKQILFKYRLNLVTNAPSAGDVKK